MALNFSGLERQVRHFHRHLPPGEARLRKPVVVLLHGLGGDRNDWMNPFQDRNWPYDHQSAPEMVDLGLHSKPPIAKLPGLETKFYLSPRLSSNARGADGSDDRSWWHALVTAGFAVFTYSQVSDLMMPLDEGPVAQFTKFMETLRRDVLDDPAFKLRPVVILGHSRGGLIGRAFLGSAGYRSGLDDRYPRVAGLITLCSPHGGSHMALMDDKIIAFLEKVQKIVPRLPNDVGNEAINTLKKKIDDYVGVHGDEIEPGSPLFQALEAQEPIPPGIRCISVGGTSPRFFRLYLWTFTADSLKPRKTSEGKIRFHWKAKATEAKGASPIPDGLPLRLLGIDVDEILPGRGDGLTANSRCRFPSSFRAEEHLSVRLSHAEALWDPDLQKEIIKRLDTF
jgi:pimeloyl-ACP methyl ester carboxylesterase